jgi:hypothetical protein
VSAFAGAAEATWSIILIDTRTGEVAVGSATCLTGFDLQANTPVLLTGIGAATAQSFVDSSGGNRTFIRDRLLDGESMDTILAGLAARDGGHQTRQYGIADTRGGVLTFSGTGAGAWAGGRTGRFGDVVYAVQGNVLTGAPVVDEAVDAILETPGDLAAKLMASMEAARVMGGDGRCSCRANDPDGCGAPPPSFTKSAHIAYMLISRTGDAWNCRASYPTGTPTGDLLAFEAVDADGKPDLWLSSGVNAPGLVRLTNQSDGFIRFSGVGLSPSGGTIRSIARADFDGDGVADLLASTVNNNRVNLLRGVGAGFVPVSSFAVGGTPIAVVAGDWDGDGDADVAVANTTTSDLSILRGANNGTFIESRVALPFNPGAMAAADMDADGDLDLVVGHPGNARQISLLVNDGAGGFAVGVLRSGLGFSPSFLIAQDLSEDGRADVVFASAGSIGIITNPADAASDRVISVPTNAVGIEAADFDEDGALDLIATTSAVSGSVCVYRNAGGGAFPTRETWTVGFAPGRLVVRDFDLDGDLDVVTTSGSNAVVLANLAGAGRMPNFENAGCASGSGFMEFNVANTRAADPDPVLTLRGLYDQWRNGLVRVPDAVATGASWLDDRAVPADGFATRTLRVTLRDWRGEAVVGPVVFDVARAGGDGGAGVSLVQSREVGSGVYDLVVRAGRGCGVARVAVGIAAGDRRVVLMPAPTLGHTTAADANDDGFVDFFDYDLFVTRFETGGPGADLTGDGFVDGFDYAAFVQGFEEGC